jgi:peptidylprolyl isomerase
VEAVSAAEASRATDGRLRAWGAYCPGVVGMGRQADPGTSNSEIFFMRDAARRLDRDYTVWGKVVSGLDVVRAMAVGEPPAQPDRMLKVRVMADLPAAEQPRLEILDERGPAFGRLVARARAAKGADFTVCDVEVPVRSRP